MKILIVDDNPNMGALLQDMLNVFDFDSVYVGNGQEALEKLDSSFALVITDIRMPTMTGLELLDHIKSRHPNLPVVLMTGYAYADKDSEAHKHRPEAILNKPFMMSNIEKMLFEIKLLPQPDSEVGK